MSTVVICSPIRCYREGLGDVLPRAGDFDIVGLVADPLQCVDTARRTRPDLVLLDATAPSAVRAAHTLGQLEDPPLIVALAPSESGEETVVACAEAGVAAYVTRDDGLQDLVNAMSGATLGQLHCSPVTAGILARRVAAMALRSGSGEMTGRAPRVRLTRRELEIAALVGDGLSNKEIANLLQIELSTVKNHVHNVLEKLGVTRRLDMAPALEQLGLLPDPV